MSRAQTANKLSFLPPSKFVMAIVKATGQFGAEYPTIILSYMDKKESETPDNDTLVDIQAFSLNLIPIDGSIVDADVEIVAFAQPRKELMDFADSFVFTITLPVDVVSPIFERIDEDGRYVVMVNTQLYSYKALVDDESGEVIEASIDYRRAN